jgi:prephenate dehydratase
LLLSQYFKGVERQDVSSTSKAAEIVSKETEERGAAIASRFAAEYHGVDVLKENIEDRADNTTRFLIFRNMRAERTAQLELLGQDRPATPTTHKTLISFAIDHSLPGALANALLIFKAHGLNLTSINTRPSLKRAWQYIFFVECGRLPSDENKEAVLNALNDLRHVTEFCRDLGTWKDQLGASLD